MSKLSKSILIFLIVLSGLILTHRPILTATAMFLVPTSREFAEVLILEGSQLVKTSALKTGMKLLSEGRANRIVVVLHTPLKEGQVFAMPKKYAQFIIEELEHMGLPKEKVNVISVPILGHPITLSEARFVVAKLTQENARSALLVSEGFHTRRSFGVYKEEGLRLGLSVVPYAFFTEYKCDSWWHDTEGISDFLAESVKLSYYLLRGYVPLGVLWNL